MQLSPVSQKSAHQHRDEMGTTSALNLVDVKRHFQHFDKSAAYFYYYCL